MKLENVRVDCILKVLLIGLMPFVCKADQFPSAELKVDVTSVPCEIPAGGVAIKSRDNQLVILNDDSSMFLGAASSRIIRSHGDFVWFTRGQALMKWNRQMDSPQEVARLDDFILDFRWRPNGGLLISTRKSIFETVLTGDNLKILRSFLFSRPSRFGYLSDFSGDGRSVFTGSSMTVGIGSDGIKLWERDGHLAPSAPAIWTKDGRSISFWESGWVCCLGIEGDLVWESKFFNSMTAGGIEFREGGLAVAGGERSLLISSADGTLIHDFGVESRALSGPFRINEKLYIVTKRCTVAEIDFTKKRVVSVVEGLAKSTGIALARSGLAFLVDDSRGLVQLDLR